MTLSTEAAIFLTLGSSTLGSVAPVILTWNGLDDTSFVGTLLTFGNALSGGVMLATGFMHLLADALEYSLQIDGDKGNKISVLYPLLWTVIGIQIPFVLEKSGLAFYLLQHGSCFTDHYSNIHSSVSCTIASGHSQDEDTEDPRKESVSSVESRDVCPSKCVIPSVSDVRLLNRVNILKGSGVDSALSTSHPGTQYDATGITSNPKKPHLFNLARKKSELQHLHSGKGHHHHEYPSKHGKPSKHVHPSKHNHTIFATFLMFAILSMHSLIAGATIGAMVNSPEIHQSLLTTFCAFTLHKIFESLALGVSMSQHMLARTTIVQLFVYNIAAPLGILFGSSFSSKGDVLQVELIGLSAGSFVYVALVEIMADEFENEEYRIAKFVAFTFGAGVMALLALFA